MTIPPATKEEYDEAVISRLERLLDDMGWEPQNLAKKVYKNLGYESPKGFVHRFERPDSRRLDAYMFPIIADELGIDPAYLYLLTDDLTVTDPDGTYASRVKIKSLEARLASISAARTSTAK